MVLPTTLAGVLTSGIVTAMVPAYVEARDKGGRPLARRLSGAVLAWIGLAGIAVSVLLVVFANPIISIAGPGLDAASHDGAVQYLYVMAPVAFLAAVSGILYALCQAEDLFASIAIGSFVGTVTTFVIMLLLWGSLNLMALAVGTLIGQLVGVVILLVATARASAAPSLTLRSKGLELGAFLRHAAPLTLSSAILQVNVVFDRAIASLIAPGGVSALRYAEVLVRTPISAISPAWGSAMYPTLVRAARDRDNSLASTTSRSLRFAIGVFVPIAMLTAAVAPVAVAVAYGRGAFTPVDIDRTARVVAGFAPLIVVLMTSPVLAGAHNARRTGVVLLAGGITNVTTNVILDVVFGAWLGVAGIALASSVSTTIVAVFFAWRLRVGRPRVHAAAHRPRARPRGLGRRRAGGDRGRDRLVGRRAQRPARRAPRAGPVRRARAGRLRPRGAARRPRGAARAHAGPARRPRPAPGARRGLSGAMQLLFGVIGESPLADATFARFVASAAAAAEDGSSPRLAGGPGCRVGSIARSAASWEAPGSGRFFHVDGQVRVVDGAETTGRGLDDAGRSAIGRLYDRHGASAWARLDGSFCLVVRDGPAVHIAMDVVGAHAVYWWLSDGVLAFHSHLRDLAAAYPGALTEDWAAIGSFLEGGRYLPTTTPWREIRHLGAGQALAFQDGVATTRDHFAMAFEPADPALPDDRVVDDVIGLLEAAVARCWRDADEPVLPLSGGMDSRFLAAELVRRNGPHSVPTITWGEDRARPGCDAIVAAGVAPRARARQRLVREAAAAHARVVRPGRVPLERGSATARSTSPTTTASTPSSRASATGRCSAATSASGPTRPC